MVRALLLLVLPVVLAAASAQAQFTVRPESARDRACRMSDRVPGMVADHNERTGDGYTVASLRDSRGRCTLGLHHEPFDDELYGPLPTAEAVAHFLAGSGFPSDGAAVYMTDAAPGGWVRWEVRDHLGLLAGHVALHRATHSYLYFHRYGHTTYLAVHTGGKRSDQWSVLSTDGRTYYGAIYAADPPSSYEGRARTDERMVNRYPFLYQYQFPSMPPPRVPGAKEPRFHPELPDEMRGRR